MPIRRFDLLNFLANCGWKTVRVPPSAPIESVRYTHESEGDGTSGLCDVGTFDGTLFPLKCGYGDLGHCLHVPNRGSTPLLPASSARPRPCTALTCRIRHPSPKPSNRPEARESHASRSANLTALRGKPDRTSREKNRIAREGPPHLEWKTTALRGKQTAAKLLTEHGPAAARSCLR